MKKIIILALALNFILPFLGGEATITHAETYTIKLLEKITPLGSATSNGETITGDNGLELFANYVSLVYNYLAFVAGLFCVAVIIFQGVNIIMGGANNSFVSEAKDKIMQSIFSLILLLAAAMVLKLINPTFFT
ncbi:MAG TPA: hypothetical protein VIT68_05200 [Candidatus Gracilibacteria bacterium]